MNKYTSTQAEEIQRLYNASISRTYLNSFGINNIFKKEEAENKIKFMKTTVIIPWYLKIFSKAIINIAYSSFKDGLSDGCTDTVTIKRPRAYRGKINE